MANQKVVLITGCSGGGIGHALAKWYHTEGLRVLATARRIESLHELQALGIECMQLDVTSTESIKEVRTLVDRSTGGRLDILVNNAGQFMASSAVDAPIEASRALFDVNLFGPMNMVYHFSSLLVNSGHGCIVNMGSLAGFSPVPFQSSYNASKAALHSYSDTLRLELQPYNIRVITVVAGGVESKMIRPPVPSFLPDSLYYPINAESEEFNQDNYKSAITADEFARGLVSQSLSARPKAWYWRGAGAWIVWILCTFFSRTVFDPFLTKRYALDKLAAIIGKKAI